MNGNTFQKLRQFILNRYHLIGFYLLTTVFLDIGLRTILPDVHWRLRYSICPTLCILWSMIICANDLYRKKADRTPATIFLYIFFLITLISGIRSYFGYSFIVYFLLQIMFSYLFFTAPKHTEDGEWRHCIDRYSKIICVYVTIISLLSIFFFYTKIQFTLPWGVHLDYGNEFFGAHYNSTRFRYVGMLDHAVSGSMRCALSIFLGFYLLENKKISLPFQLFSVVINTWMILLTDTRMSAISALFVPVYFLIRFLHQKIGKKKTILAVLVLILLGCAGLFILKNEKILATISAIRENPFNELSQISSARLKIWRGCIEEFLTEPLLGVGLENNAVPYSLGYQFPLNLIVSLLLYTGILGTAAFSASMICCAGEIRKNKSRIISSGCFWLVLTLLCLLFETMVESTIIADNSHIETGYFWLILGYLVFFPQNGRKP